MLYKYLYIITDTMALEHILLGLLRQPASGYDLKKTFDGSVRHFWPANLSQIYPTLKRLEAEGLLTSRMGPSERGPQRKIYALTPSGRERLHQWLLSGPEVGTERFGYLAQLFVMDDLADEQQTLDFMRQLQRHMVQWLQHLEQQEKKAGAKGTWLNAPSKSFHRYAGLRMGVHSLRAKVAWCNETVDRLEQRLALIAEEATK